MTTPPFDLDAFERRLAHARVVKGDDAEQLIAALRTERAARAAAEREWAASRSEADACAKGLIGQAGTLLYARDSLQNAYDVLFETHQREMTRLHAERDAARADAALLRKAIIGWYHADNTPDFAGVEADLVWLAQRLIADDRPDSAPFLALRDAVRAYRVAVQACDGIADAEVALFAALDAIDGRTGGLAE